MRSFATVMMGSDKVRTLFFRNSFQECRETKVISTYLVK